MARNYVALPYEYLEEMDELDDAEFGRLCRALLEYGRDGTEMQLEGNERFYAKRVMAREASFKESYDSICSTNRENGRKGGRPRKPAKNRPVSEKTDRFFEKPEETEKTQDKVEDEVKDKVKVKDEANPLTGDITPLNPPLQGEVSLTGYPEVDKAVMDFVDQRNLSKKPMSPAALGYFVKELKEMSGGDRRRMLSLLERAISGGWSTVYPDERARGRPAGGREPPCNDFVQAYMDVRGGFGDDEA